MKSIIDNYALFFNFIDQYLPGGFKDIDRSLIGLTDEFPVHFRKIVIKQLGSDYDNFEKLEELCKPMTGATSKEFKEIPGI